MIVWCLRLRAEEAKKGSKKHAETTTAWRKLSSERVRAVERQMRDYEADSADEEPVHKAETDHSDSEESECEHLPVHEQVLYPTEVSITTEASSLIDVATCAKALNGALFQTTAWWSGSSTT